MTQYNNNFSYFYEDECISYKSLFTAFSRKDFNELDEIYNQLDIDIKLINYFLNTK